MSHYLFINAWLALSLFSIIYNMCFTQSNLINAYTILILYICAALTSTYYNDDMRNYHTVYMGMIKYNALAWNFEPGFNFILYSMNWLTGASDLGFFLVRLLPGLILSYTIVKNRFHTSFTPFYICCLGLVLSSTTLRASYAFSFICFALSQDLRRLRHQLNLWTFTAISMHMSVLPAAIVMLAKKLKSNGMLIFLVILCLIFLSASQIILQMIDIMNAKFIDRGSTFRSNIPLRGIQFIVILYVLLILFKNNGKYVILKIGKFGIFLMIAICFISIINYGLSRIVLYCYPVLFIRNSEVKSLRSLNQIICLLSLPAVLIMYIEFF